MNWIILQFLVLAVCFTDKSTFSPKFERWIGLLKLELANYSCCKIYLLNKFTIKISKFVKYNQ